MQKLSIYFVPLHFAICAYKFEYFYFVKKNNKEDTFKTISEFKIQNQSYFTPF